MAVEVAEGTYIGFTWSSFYYAFILNHISFLAEPFAEMQTLCPIEILFRISIACRLGIHLSNKFIVPGVS